MVSSRRVGVALAGAFVPLVSCNWVFGNELATLVLRDGGLCQSATCHDASTPEGGDTANASQSGDIADAREADDAPNGREDADESSFDVASAGDDTTYVRQGAESSVDDAQFDVATIDEDRFDADRFDAPEVDAPAEDAPALDNPVAALRPILWLDASRGYAGGIWSDQSGNRRDARAGTGSIWPTVDTLNGRSVLTFLQGGQMDINIGFPSFSQGFTWFLVLNTLGDDQVISLGVSFNSFVPPGGEPYDQLGMSDSVIQMCDPIVGTCRQAWTTPNTIGQWQRVVVSETPGVVPGIRWYKNGRSVTYATTLKFPWPAPWDTKRADAAIAWRNWQGQLAEIIVIDSPVDDAALQDVDTYLAKKWNVK